MTPNLSRLLVVLASLFVLSCQDGVAEPPSVRDVRPTTFEINETITIELHTDIPVEVPTQVQLKGVLIPVEGERRPIELELPRSRATAPAGHKTSRRVLADVDALVEEHVGGHATFVGKVLVLQNDQVVAESRRLQLDLFPRTARKLAYHLVGNKEANDLVDWLGLELKQVAVEGQKEATGMQVTYVTREFSAVGFIQRYDCGVFDVDRKICRAPLNAVVTREEALHQGFDPDVYDEIDRNGDGKVDRQEADHFNRTDSPAAKAGIAKGDIIVAAAGHPISQLGDLADAWKTEGGVDIPVTLLRDGKTVEIKLPRYGKPASIPEGFLLGGIIVAVGLLIILPVPLLGGIIVVWERKIAGRMQSRPGPNRVGPNGWLQWLADGIKLIVKEDLIPQDADPYLFRASPYLVFLAIFGTFVVIPFTPVLIAADLNIGILYLLSITSVAVVGIIMGGWASNSKWSLLGGMRSAAQIISYELPASLAVLTIVVMAGSLSTQDLVKFQGGAPWNWAMFDNPFSFACFFIFFISALAEGNRTPFDLPEAESELVSGYNTEYSGFRFSIYFLAEWVNLIVIGAVVTTVFLGGWRIPGVSPAEIEANGWLHLLSFGLFAAKVTFFVFVIIWIRWTLPRFRVDQMMSLCWKYFLPISLVSLVAVAGWVAMAPVGSMPRSIMRWAMFAIGAAIVILFITRVRHTAKTTRVLELRGA